MQSATLPGPRGAHTHVGRGRANRTAAAAKQKKGPEYGSGRAKLPGLADMLGSEGMPSTGTGGSSSNSSDNSSSGRRTGSSGGAPTLSEYLQFGRLIGESPADVQQQLSAGGAPVAVDAASQELLQDWEAEELEQYAMFEAVMAALDARPAGGAATASAKKLARNKNVAGGVEADRLRAHVRSEYERLLAAREQGPRALGAAQRTRPSSQGQARTQTPSAVGLASKPERPGEVKARDAPPSRLLDDEDFDFDSAWAEAESFEAAETANRSAAEFSAQLGKPGGGGAAVKPQKRAAGSAFGSSTRGSLAAVGRLQGALPDQPAPPQPPPSSPASSKLQLNLSRRPARPAGPVALNAKPKFTAAARQAAQRPPPPPAPTLAAKPSKPAAASAPAPAAPAPKPQPPPQLTAKPPRPEEPALAPSSAAADAAPAAELPSPAAQAAPTEQPPPSPVPAAAATPPKPELQRPAPAPAPAPQQPAARDAIRVLRAERRARNAEAGAQLLLDRSDETMTVWQANAAGVLVRSERLSGFVPMSQLAPASVARVLREEQMLLAAVSAAAIVTQQEAGGGGGAAVPASPRPELDAATRGAFRRQALAAVLVGRTLTARVVNVDEQTGRVVLSERAAKQEQFARRPPTPQQLQAAAELLGQTVDATVVSVKPFGCFVEFAVPAGAGSEASMVVGLVHRGEIGWDPAADVESAVQEGQRVRARVLHVDAAKARVFLSIRKTRPNPLLDTLDSLVTASAAAVAGGRGGGVPDSGLDQRATLGDLPEALAFCEALRRTRGVAAAELGVRLQSPNAVAQQLEVYISRDAAGSLGSTVAAVDGSAPEAPAAAAPAADARQRSFNLVLRKEASVQEVRVTTALSRQELRQAAADAVAAVVGARA